MRVRSELRLPDPASGKPSENADPRRGKEIPVGAHRIEGIWLAQSFLDDFVLIYPVYAIMMLEQGISGLELSLLFVIWSGAALIFEVPSGIVGDLVNRKGYLLVGSTIKGGAFLAWLIHPSLAGYAFGFLLWSLGGAIHSGTQQSLLHDLLTERGQAEAFARIYGRGKAFASLGVLAAMALGGFAAESGYAQVLLLSVLAPVAAGTLVCFGLPEPPRSGAVAGDGAATLRVALATLRRQRLLRVNALMFVSLMAMSGVVDEYLGPLLAEPDVLSLGAIGVLYGLMLGARALGTALAHRLRELRTGRVGLISLCAHLVLVLASLASVPWLVMGCALYFALMGVVEVLLESNMQRQIDVQARATITSVTGACLEVFGIGFYLLIGSLADGAGWAAAIGLAAVLVALLSALCAALADRFALPASGP